jgi:hypothetical protein
MNFRRPIHLGLEAIFERKHIANDQRFSFMNAAFYARLYSVIRNIPLGVSLWP